MQNEYDDPAVAAAASRVVIGADAGLADEGLAMRARRAAPLLEEMARVTEIETRALADLTAARMEFAALDRRLRALGFARINMEEAGNVG